MATTTLMGVCRSRWMPLASVAQRNSESGTFNSTLSILDRFSGGLTNHTQRFRVSPRRSMHITGHSATASSRNDDPTQQRECTAAETLKHHNRLGSLLTRGISISGTIRAAPVGATLRRRAITTSMSNFEILHSLILVRCTLPRQMAVKAIHYRASIDETRTPPSAKAFDVSSEVADIFVFPERGTVVSWGFTESVVADLSKCLGVAATTAYSPSIVEQETDFMKYIIRTSLSATTVLPMGVSISQHGNNPADCRIEEKFAVSDAIAESVRLAIWEEDVSKAMDRSLKLAQELRASGKLRLSSDRVLQWFAEIFSMRLALAKNLNQRDLYWDQPELERLNSETREHFELEQRHTEMNTHLDHITEVAEIVRITLSERHSHNLEWGIIWLIIIEVGFEVFHYHEQILQFLSSF
eukprot:m.163824 g.163824  ORF g.163824 m.163824 type:complete len:412 (-) comp31306_c0_seq1:62-1297(-)